MLAARLLVLVLTCSQLMKKFDRGDLPKNDWLDRLAFRRIEEIHTVDAPVSDNIEC